MVKLPLFRRACRLPGQFVAHIKSIKWRLRRPTVRYVFLSVCVFVSAAAVILFIFAHPSGENDDNYPSDIPVEQSGVRPVCDSKGLQYLIRNISSSLDIFLGTHL